MARRVYKPRELEISVQNTENSINEIKNSLMDSYNTVFVNSSNSPYFVLENDYMITRIMPDDIEISVILPDPTTCNRRELYISNRDGSWTIADMAIQFYENGSIETLFVFPQRNLACFAHLISDGVTWNYTIGTRHAGLFDLDIFGALSGTSGTPSLSNKFVTNADSRLSDNRAPVAHQLDSASVHTVSGLTTGNFLKATSATTFGFATHGLTYADVGADAAGAAAAITLAGLGGVPTSRTVNSKALSDNIVLGLASSDFVNQGTTTTVLHGNAAGNPAFGAIVEADITLANNTTNNANTTNHGFLPQVPNDATKGVLGTTGAWGIVGYSPIGAIIAWHKSFTNTPTLPSNWVECNGQTLSDAESVYNGQVIPNLNGAAAGANLSNGDNLGKTGDVFLRGDETSGVTQFDAFQGHKHAMSNKQITQPTAGATAAWAPTVQNTTNVSTTEAVSTPTTDGTNGTPRTGTVTVPRNMSVVWIMRIK
jgi:hypothetical protein